MDRGTVMKLSCCLCNFTHNFKPDLALDWKFFRLDDGRAFKEMAHLNGTHTAISIPSDGGKDDLHQRFEMLRGEIRLRDGLFDA